MGRIKPHLRNKLSLASLIPFLFSGCVVGCTPHISPSASLLPLTLWAWERPERLRFLDSQHVAVAFLAGTIIVQKEGDIKVQPRLQPLELPPGIRLTAVIRIDAGWIQSPRFEPISRMVTAIQRLADWPEVTAVQIDFDATRSQRSFYRELLVRVRRNLPETWGLSITALVSWCLQDRWLAGLPVDFAVPMFFRMGAGSAEMRRVMAREKEFLEPLCRMTVGVMDDEPWPVLRRPRPVFAFRVRPWDATAVQHLQEEINRWSNVLP